MICSRKYPLIILVLLLLGCQQKSDSNNPGAGTDSHKINSTLSNPEQKSADNPQALLERSVALMQAGKNDSALTCLDASLRLNPNLAPTHYYRGAIMKKRKDFINAFASYQKAVECDSSYALGYCGRGSIWAEQGDTTKALADFSRAVVLDPTNPLVYNLRGVLHHKMKNFRLSIDDFSHCIELDPKETHNYMNRAWEYLCLKDTTNALKDIRTAKQIGDPDAEAWLKRLQ